MSLAAADQLLLPRDPTAALEAATKQYVDSTAPSPDYISGMKLSYVDATHISVGTGAATIQSLGQSRRLTAPQLLLIQTPVGGWMHIYFDYVAGAGNAFSSYNDAPDAPFFGTARSRPSHPTHRYIGSVLVVPGAVVPFTMIGTKMRYLANPSNAPFRVLSGGTATTSTTIDLSGVLPATARIAHVRLLNNATGGQVYIGNSDMGATLPSNYMTTARSTSEFESELLTDANQAINYVYNTSPGSGCNIDVNGYEFER